MKTGGTLNFLKRAGAIFMLIAVFASSCNKYADDFKQLNTKLDALATQVAGVTQLTTDMTALKSQVTALQTSVAGLPNVASITALQTALTAISGKVDALTTTLNAVAASGTATKAVVDGLKTDLAALAAKVAKDNADAVAKLVAMDGKLDANQTAALKAINDQAAALSAKIAAETVAITGKVDAAAAASAAAAAANLAQMATNQAALVASLNGISAAQAANLAALNAAIAELKANMTEQFTAMTGANAANLATLLASNAALTAAMTAQFDAMTAANLANLASMEAKLAATQADLTTLINDIQAANSGSFASLLAAQAAQTAQDALTALETANALAQLIASQNAQIAAADANNAASAAAIAALKAMLDAQAISLKIILDNTSMYNGDVVITTDAEVDFYLAKLAQLGIINGQGATALTVNTNGISASRIADVNIICSKIKAVIGGGNATISFKTGNGLDLSALAYVKGNLSVTGLSGATGVDVKLGALATVSGNVTFNYDGPYESTTLTTVGGNLVLTNVPTSTSSPVRVGTTSINFPSAAVAGVLSDATTPGNPTFASVTGAIVVGGQMTGITANKATSVKLLAATQAAGLAINAALATSVDLGNLVNINYNTITGVTTAGGAIVVNSAAGSTVNLDKFLGRNGTSTAVQEDIQLEGPTAASIPLWLTGIFRSATVKDLTLAKNDMLAAADAIFVPGSVIENLTLGNLKGFANLYNYPTLKTVNITGNNPALGTGASVSAWAANAVLTTLNVSGAVYNVYIWNTPKLTTFTTAAGSTINDVEIDGATLLAGVSFGHKHLSTSIGSNIRIYNNPELLSLTTSTDKPQWLEVGNNPKLATADFSSYQNFLFFTPMTIKIYGNKFGGKYTNAVAATPTDGYIQSTLTSAALGTLKGLFAAWDADQALGVAKTSTATWSIDVRLGNYVTLGTGTTNGTLAARLSADAAHKVSDTGLNYSVPGTGLATYRELRDILQ